MDGGRRMELPWFMFREELDEEILVIKQRKRAMG